MGPWLRAGPIEGLCQQNCEAQSVGVLSHFGPERDTVQVPVPTDFYRPVCRPLFRTIVRVMAAAATAQIWLGSILAPGFAKKAVADPTVPEDNGGH
jgi:hypothetical protein